MDSLIINLESCRMCLKYDENQIMLTPEIEETIKSLLNIEIKKEDKLTKICEICLEKINTMYGYSKEFQESDETLKMILDNIQESVEVKSDEEVNIIHITVNDVEVGQQKNQSDDLKVDDNEDIAETTQVLETTVIEGEMYERIEISDNLVNRCYICESFYDTNDVLNQHLLTHKDKLPYDCAKCGTKCRTTKSLNRHLSFYDKDNAFKCKSCQKTFPIFRNLVQHEKYHHSKPDLSKTGNGVTGEEEKKFICEYCGKAFSSQNLLKSHNNVHTGLAKTQCKTCGKIYSSTNVLARHERVHTGERPYKCTFCTKSFKQNSELIDHTRILHTKEAPYSCSLCNAKFSTRSYLYYHKKKHEYEKKPVSKPEKNVHCPQCDYKCFSQETLATHIKSHTGANACPICDRKFTVFNNMVRHLKVHSGDKPYVCECGKSFSQASILKTHQRIHTGVKPYECPLCFKKFRDHSTLYKHKRIHRTDE